MCKPQLSMRNIPNRVFRSVGRFFECLTGIRLDLAPRAFSVALLILAGGLAASAQAQQPATTTNVEGSTPYLTPEEELKTFDLKPGYSLELVVSDPVIKEPVVAVFDGNGRMYVAEMRTYMQN